jgi:hypothetical protein
VCLPVLVWFTVPASGPKTYSRTSPNSHPGDLPHFWRSDSPHISIPVAL